MSKNIIVALTVALCVVAAGVGGFFATKMGSSQAAPAATTASTVPAETAPGAGVPAGAAATEGAIPELPAQSAAAPVAVASSVSTPEPALNERRVAEVKRQAARKVAPAEKPADKPAATTPATPADPSWTGLDKPWPSGSAGTTGTASAATETQAVTPPPVEQQAPPPVVAVPPPTPEPQFDEVVVESDAVLGIKLDSTVNSETARLEDPVEAHVSRDLRVGSLVAIPAGSRVLGVVSQVEKGGKMKNRARLGIRFHTLVFGDGTRTSIVTDAIFRDGEAPGQGAASKMGAAAAGGAILGAILGGGKGAAIGGSIGAAGGAAAVMAGDRNAAVLKAGTSVTVRLLRPVTVIVARN